MIRLRTLVLLAMALLTIGLVACKKEGAASLGVSVPNPDSTTYFPLLPGSYWVYEDVIEGAAPSTSRDVDSVLSLTETDSGLVAEVAVKTSGRPESRIQYRVDAQGLVWINHGTGRGFEPYTSLYPRIGDRIGNQMKFSACADVLPAPTDCVLLQAYRLDDSTITEVQKAAWNGLFFKKGIGLESNAGEEGSTELTEYRIGAKGSIVVTAKGGDGSAKEDAELGCAVPKTASGACPALTPDLDGDKIPDTLQLVSTDDPLPNKTPLKVQNPFGKSPLSLPEAVAVRVKLSSEPGAEYLLHDSAYFSSPIWKDEKGRFKLISIASNEAAPFPEAEEGAPPKAKGDRVGFPSEAAIDIYLYYSEQGFQVYWPPEEP